MKQFSSFFVLVFLACASTPVQPMPDEKVIYMQPNPDGGAGLIAPLPDGGSCVMMRPEINKQALALDLMPPDSPGGMVIIKCVVRKTGEIAACRTIKDEGGLADVTIKRLLSMRGTPGTCDGEPIDIDYVFNLMFKRAP